MGAIGSRQITDEEAQGAFDEIDVNKDGSVSSSELKPLLARLLKRTPSRREITSLIMSVDDSSDGILQFPEFLQLVRKFESWERDDENLLKESKEKIASEVFELALREPLLPGFLKFLNMSLCIDPLVRLGFQTSHDLAYLQPDMLTSSPFNKTSLKPVHKRKLLHCAAVLRCRKPPLSGTLSRAERRGRRLQLVTLGLIGDMGEDEEEEEKEDEVDDDDDDVEQKETSGKSIAAIIGNASKGKGRVKHVVEERPGDESAMMAMMAGSVEEGSDDEAQPSQVQTKQSTSSGGEMSEADAATQKMLSLMKGGGGVDDMLAAMKGGGISDGGGGATTDGGSGSDSDSDDDEQAEEAEEDANTAMERMLGEGTASGGGGEMSEADAATQKMLSLMKGGGGVDDMLAAMKGGGGGGDNSDVGSDAGSDAESDVGGFRESESSLRNSGVGDIAALMGSSGSDSD